MAADLYLTPQQAQQAQEALLSAFKREELERVVHAALSRPLEEVAAPGTLAAQVHELLLWANRQGQAAALLDAARTANPGNPDLKAFLAQLDTQAPSRRPAVPGHHIPLDKPTRAQHFTGRQLELANLVVALKPGCRVTLCGPGGIGKSALAAEAVWQLAPGNEPPALFPDGVFHYVFTEQAQAESVFEAIADTFGVDSRPNAGNAARAALRGRQVLLVLESAENAANLEDIVEVAGGCGLLITSRRHRDAPDAFTDIAPLPVSESLALLRAWAGAQVEDEAAARHLVDLLGGLPLAILLAGRYMAQRKQLAAEYVEWVQEEGMSVLEFGTDPHKSTARLMERSLAQVSDGARSALAVCGVLAYAPFAKEAIAAALDLKLAEAQRALGELVDYGLLVRPQVSFLVTHALIHTYIRSELPPPVDAVVRLAQYYCQLAKTLSAQGMAGYAELEPHRRHLVETQSACVNLGLWEVVHQIALHTVEYLSLRGHWSDRAAVLENAAAAAQAMGNRHTQGAYVTQLGNVYADLGEVRRAIVLYTQALALAREIGDRQAECDALGSLGLAYRSLGEVDKAIDSYLEALAIAKEAGYRRAEGMMLANLGLAYRNLGDANGAIEFFMRCLTIARKIGDRRLEGKTLGDLGLAYFSLGEVRHSIELHEQQLAIAREVGDLGEEGYALSNLGLANYSIGLSHTALELLEQALTIMREIGNRRGQGAVLGNLGNTYRRLGNIRRAIELFDQQLAITRDIEDRRGEAAALGNLGTAYIELGDARWGMELHERQLVIARNINDRRGEGAALSGLGEAYLVSGQTQRAVEFYEQHIAIAKDIGDRNAEATASWRLGLAYAGTGDLQQAMKAMQRCIDYENAIGHVDAEAHRLEMESLRIRQ